MSVREYRFGEIEQLYEDICGAKAKLCFCTVRSEQLQQALRAAYYANRAALGCTYNEDIKVPKCELPRGYNPKAKLKDAYQQVGLLLYNCISNGGRDFLPEKDREILERLQREIARHVIEQYKEVDEHGNV